MQYVVLMLSLRAKLQTYITFLQLDRWKVSQSFANRVGVFKKGNLRQFSVLYVKIWSVFVALLSSVRTPSLCILFLKFH